MYISIACKLASILLGAALARMRSPYLVHEISYESILLKAGLKPTERENEPRMILHDVCKREKCSCIPLWKPQLQER